MKIKYEQKNDVGIIKISGKLVASNSTDLKTAFKEYLKTAVKFVIDLSEMDFIDSTGLGALVSCLKISMEAKGDIFIANLAPKPRLVFEMTRAFKIFKVFDDVDGGVANFIYHSFSLHRQRTQGARC